MRRFTPLLSLVLVACAAKQSEQQPGSYPQAPAGGAPPPPAAQPTSLAPGYQTPPGNALRPEGGEDFASVEDAERALEQARSELALVAPARDKTSGKKGEEPAPLARGDAACGNACKAFASLRRAADAVCRLAGEADTRCVRARSLVKENEVRVSACGCEPPKE